VAFNIQRQETTGLWIIVDGSGKVVSRAELPSDAVNLAVSKGVPREELSGIPAQAQQLERQERQAAGLANEPGSTTEEPLSQAEEKAINNEELGTDADETSQEDDIGTTNQDSPDTYEIETAPGNQTTEEVEEKQPDKKGDGGAKKFVEVSNPLHDFASYTYALTLHALNESDFNTLVENDANWRPTRTLIASAGRRGDQQSGTFIRDPRFYEDFYFNDFKMTTIVGLNNTSKSTNAIEISFTLLEPNGLTLINRLVEMSADAQIGAKNYLEMPYLLQIDFHGYPSDSGTPIELLNQRKYIPIRIIELKVKVGVGGAEYACRAIPFNHQAFNDTSSATPANFEISGKNLQEFFDSTSQENIAKQKSEREEAEDKKIKDLEKAKADPNLDARDLRLAQANIDQAKAQKDQAIKSATYVSTSYVAAYNAWNKSVQDKKYASDYNEIRVVFDAEILANDGGTLVMAPDQSAKKTPMANTADPKQVAAARRANAGAGNSGPDFTKGTYNIYMATSVMEVINVAMRNTKFIRDQVIDPNIDAQANADKKDKPLKWWKIVPHIKLKSFDRRLNKYSKVITYYVQVHEYYNRKNLYATTSMPKGWVKKYSYMYTGQNRDIIDFNIDFDTLYYTAINIDRGKSTAVQSTKPSGSDEEELALTDQETKALPEPEFNSAQPAIYHNVSELPAATSTGDAKRDSKTQAVAGLAADIYSGSRGDMINIKLKILGDPTFIKQDDIFFNPGQANYKPDLEKSGQMTKNNSIRTDTGEIHALVEFFTPTDRDENTGLLRVDGNWWRSLFSGIYRILTIETEMRQGRFEQTLDMIRLFNQTKEAGAPDDYDFETRRSKPPSAERQNTEQTTEEDYTQPAPLSGDGSSETGVDIDELGGTLPDDDAEANIDSPVDPDFETEDDPPTSYENEAEYEGLNRSLSGVEETDINQWNDDFSTNPEQQFAVLGNRDTGTA
jgi:hypothetical protein